MSDPVTTHAAQAADALQGHARDARVEQLLLAGLDHYFVGHYAQAIHVWTRVLFLDRGHATPALALVVLCLRKSRRCHGRMLMRQDDVFRKLSDDGH